MPFRRRRVSLWEAIIWYMNNNRDNVIKRKELLHHLRQAGYPINSSIDTYRNYLQQAGYLRAANRRGWYTVEHQIPLGLSVDTCRDQAYGEYRPDPLIQVIDNRKREALRYFHTLPLKEKKEPQFLDEDEFQV